MEVEINWDKYRNTTNGTLDVVGAYKDVCEQLDTFPTDNAIMKIDLATRLTPIMSRQIAATLIASVIIFLK